MLFRAARTVPADRRAVAATELAVLLPFLGFIFVIAIDYARIFYAALTIANCARNGAVYASNIANYPGWEGNPTQYTSVQQAAIADGSNLNPPLTANNVSVTSSTQNGNPVVSVTVTYTFTTITNFPGLPQITLQSTSEQTRVAPAAPS